MRVNPEVLVGTTKRLFGEAGKDVGSVLQNFWMSGRTILQGWGEHAGVLLKTMEEVDNTATMRAGKDFATVKSLIKGLNKDEKLHVFDILEDHAKPNHQDYADIAAKIRTIFDSYADDATDLGLDAYSAGKYNKALKEAMASGLDYQEATREAMKRARTPFHARPNYMPHYYGDEAIQMYLKEGPRKEALLKQLVNRGWAEDRQSAEVVMREILERPAEFRGGPLQHTREDLFGIGYDRDLEAVAKRYFHTSAKRLEQARRFGPRDEEAYKIINGIGDERVPTGRTLKDGSPETTGLPGVGEKIKGAAKIYTAWAGTRDPYLSNLSRILTPIHSVTLLSTAGIIQPSQLMNTVARVGWTNTLKAMAGVTKEWVQGEGGHKAWAESTGALLDSVTADLQINSLQDISQMWMKWIGMEQLDRMNRVVSAVAGRFYAESLAKNMMRKGADAAGHRRLFARMGIDADDLFKRGGKLTPDELRSAGIHVSRDTQFASSVLDLPPMRNTPAGRFIYLFKSFALQQAYFIHRELGEEAFKYHNWKPLIAYSSALTLTAPLMGELIRGVKGRRAEQPPETVGEMFRNHVENVMTVGAFGAFWDATRAMGHGPEAIMRYLAGPTAGEVVQTLGVDIPALALRRDPEPFVKHMVRRTPMIGSALYNLWWPR